MLATRRASESVFWIRMQFLTNFLCANLYPIKVCYKADLRKGWRKHRLTVDTTCQSLPTSWRWETPQVINWCRKIFVRNSNHGCDQCEPSMNHVIQASVTTLFYQLSLGVLGYHHGYSSVLKCVQGRRPKPIGLEWVKRASSIFAYQTVEALKGPKNMPKVWILFGIPIRQPKGGESK